MNMKEGGSDPILLHVVKLPRSSFNIDAAIVKYHEWRFHHTRFIPTRLTKLIRNIATLE